MRFKADENLPLEVAELFRQAGHDLHTVLDEALGGQPDSRIADACLTEKRSLITLDLDFADIRTFPPAEYQGLIVLRPLTQHVSAIVRLAQQAMALLASEPLTGRLWIVEENQIRIRE